MGLFTSVENARKKESAQIQANLAAADNLIKQQGMAFVQPRIATLNDWISRGWYSNSYVGKLLKDGGHSVPERFQSTTVKDVVSTVKDPATQAASIIAGGGTVKDFFIGNQPSESAVQNLQAAVNEEVLSESNQKNSSPYKMPLIIGGSILLLAGLSFGAYKLMKR